MAPELVKEFVTAFHEEVRLRRQHLDVQRREFETELNLLAKCERKAVK